MDEGTQGVLVFIAIAASSAAAWHYKEKRFALALIGSTVTAAILFQIVNYIHLGYIDSFFIVAIATSAVFAATISILVGLAFIGLRKKRKN